MTFRFLFLMLSFLSLSFPFASHGLELVEGLNEWVLTSCAVHKRTFNKELLPIAIACVPCIITKGLF